MDEWVASIFAPVHKMFVMLLFLLPFIKKINKIKTIITQFYHLFFNWVLINLIMQKLKIVMLVFIDLNFEILSHELLNILGLKII